MSKDKSNSIRIFWIEQDKEKSVRIYPKNVPEKNWENGTELYIFGLTEVCRYFNCRTPEEIEIPVRWCYDWLPYSDINRDYLSMRNALFSLIHKVSSKMNFKSNTYFLSAYFLDFIYE